MLPKGLGDPLASIEQRFARVRISKEWSFPDERSVDKSTHGYHRYPAKFAPSLVKQLIEKYPPKNGPIADLFAGCGTTLVESKAHGIASIGIDINPVAEIITKAKTTPLHPNRVSRAFEVIKEAIRTYKHDKDKRIVRHARIDYWFKKRQKHKIDFLHSKINRLPDKRARVFLLCALSNILKTCSKWLQSSTKPQIDPSKSSVDVFESFVRQVASMIKKNNEFYRYLESQSILRTPCRISIKDARHSGIKSNSISAIITSPPYVTSYEYADIHQLTGYWFRYFDDLPRFRKQFIGTFYSSPRKVNSLDPIAEGIVARLKKKDKRTGIEVANYFSDMESVVREMRRILVRGGRACLVIGNTELKSVKINAAQVFANMLFRNSFRIEKIIRRRVPVKHKQIPTIRNKKTGRFSSQLDHSTKLVYPNEYVIIAKKKQ